MEFRSLIVSAAPALDEARIRDQECSNLSAGALDYETHALKEQFPFQKRKPYFAGIFGISGWTSVQKTGHCDRHAPYFWIRELTDVLFDRLSARSYNRPVLAALSLPASGDAGWSRYR